jgi:hypothetical protein
MCCVVLFLVLLCCVLNTTLLQIYRYIPSYLCILFHFSRFIHIVVFRFAVFGSVPRNLFAFRVMAFVLFVTSTFPCVQISSYPTQGPYPPLPNTFCPSWRRTPLFVCPDTQSCYRPPLALARFPTCTNWLGSWLDFPQAVVNRWRREKHLPRRESNSVAWWLCSPPAAAGQIPLRCNLQPVWWYQASAAVWLETLALLGCYVA